MSFEKDIDAIDAYLDEKLPPAERALLKSRLDSDASFSMLFERQKMIRQGINGLATTDFEATLKSNTKNKIKPMSRRSLLSLAATILIVISIGAWWLMAPTSYERTANRLYKTPIVQVDRNNDTDVYTKGMISFGQANYYAAIQQFSEIIASDPDFMNAKYYKAHSLFLSGLYREARTQFDLLRDTSDNLMRERAEWFSILAGIKQGLAKDQIETELQLIMQSSNHFYQNLAGDLLKDFQ